MLFLFKTTDTRFFYQFYSWLPSSCKVLMERNELKTRLIEVEDELAHYKPR